MLLQAIYKFIIQIEKTKIKKLMLHIEDNIAVPIGDVA